MDGFEKLVKTIREEGARYNPYSLCLGEMTGKRTCRTGSLALDPDDLLVAEHLKGKLEKGDTVVLYHISEDSYVILEKVVDM